MLAWLRQCGYGVSVGGVRVDAVQYADDCTAVLPSLAAVPRFQADMLTFGRASGQYLNAGKVQLLRVGAAARAGPAAALTSGAPPPQQPLQQPLQQQQPMPFPLVDAATTLGIAFSNGGQPQRSLAEFWREPLQRVRERLVRVAKARLSIFGRAFAAAGYGLSRVLFHMEFVGLPPAGLLAELQRQTAALVDANRKPGTKGRRLTGVAAAAMPGPPRAGGFGLLPLEQHVRARAMWWAIQFVRAAVLTPATAPPWVCAAAALLRKLVPAATPLSLLAGPPPADAADRRWTRAEAVRECAPLYRLVTALEALPRARPAAAAEPLPHAVMLDAPLWGNPLLWRWAVEDDCPMTFRGARGGWRPVCTVRQLLRACPPLDPASYIDSGVDDGWHRQLWRFRRALPVELLVADDGRVRPAAETEAARRAAAAAVLRRLELPPAAGGAGPAISLVQQPSVRALTLMQTDAAAAYRAPRHEEFLIEARAPPHFCAPDLQRALAGAWRVPWENAYKETLWRLTIDGRPLYGSPRYASWRAAPGRCLCGLGTAGRYHAFWACPLARAVRGALEAELAPDQRPLTRCHLWLLQPPPRLHLGVWRVVALAALTAMDRALTALTRVCMPPPSAAAGSGGDSDGDADGSDADDGGAPHASPPLCAGARRPTAAELQLAAEAAVAAVWAAVEDFAALHARPPACWRGRRVPANHPYLHVTLAKRVAVSARAPESAPAAAAAAALAPLLSALAVAAPPPL